MGKMFVFREKRTYQILNQMIDEAMEGSFEEAHYDETELSKLEVKWKRFLSMSKLSQQKVEREHEEIKELVSDISHQVKTPLSNILLYSQMLHECAEDKTVKELTEELEKQSKKLEFLLEALVKLSRLETGILKLTQEQCNLIPVLYEVREECLEKAKKKRISIFIAIEPETLEQGIYAMLDRKWTEEALTNIVDNAIKYSEEGKQIEISIREYELFVCISVKDEGIGISEEEIPKIFQRFYRGKAVRNREGVGIGLFLARQIMEEQQGYIKVGSGPKKGTVFSLYFRK